MMFFPCPDLQVWSEALHVEISVVLDMSTSAVPKSQQQKQVTTFFRGFHKEKKNILSKFRRKNFYAVLENRTFFSGTYFTIIAF
jgi:hypothetical protein